ncbi:MAG: hypothetical protein J6K78_04145 [Tidjanibacter sp.]|nr:hypothetical protein [Tidjanibacter sp.]
MIECIRFRSVLPFDENVKEEFISEIWGGAIDRWRGNITPDIEARIEMEIATFEQVEGYMAYLYFVWRVTYDSGYYFMPYRTLAHASAVCYALGITEVDPIRLGLDFNRFMQTDKPRFVEIGLATNATKSQIQTEIMNLEFDEDRERLGERELNDDAPALIIYPSQRTAQLLGYFSDKLEYMPFDDQATFFTLLRSEDLTGVYGCNPNTVLQKYLQQAKPYFEDLIPLCADNLPAHYVFLHRRYNIASKTKFAPEIESILSETCGGILYDEQVYAIAKLVGYTPSEAEAFRKVLNKHKKQEYNTHRQRFRKYKGLFGKLIKDGGWTYPKAHLAEVARLVYTTAYLKTHFPQEFVQTALCVAASNEC